VSGLWGVRVSPCGEPQVFQTLERARVVALSLVASGQPVPPVLQRASEGAPWRDVAESTWRLAG
jgi:hypothetical protein